MTQKRNSTAVTVGAVVVLIIALFQATPAYSMGVGQKIEGKLLDFSTDTQAILLGLDNTPNPRGQMTTTGCVNFGRIHDGLAIKAISYHSSTLCYLYHRVDNVVSAGGWCSQWIVPGSVDHCVPSGGTGGSGGVGGCPPSPTPTFCDGDTPILLDLDRNQFHLSAGPATFDID